MQILTELYFTFFILGATSFGGGYAMLPILQRTIVEKKQWATQDDLVDYFAISQCTPGVIAVNVSSFIGMKLCGISGAIVATAGMVTPSIIIICTLATLIQLMAGSEAYDSAFLGIKTCVAVLIAGSAWTLLKKSITDITTARIFYLVFLAMMTRQIYDNLPLWFKTITSPICLVLMAAVLGLCNYKKEVD